jgi:hypothetical protein
VPLLRIWPQSLQSCACAPDETSIAVAIRRNFPFIERSPSIEVIAAMRRLIYFGNQCGAHTYRERRPGGYLPWQQGAP